MSADKIRTLIQDLYFTKPEAGAGASPAFQPQFLSLLRHDGLALAQNLILPAVCLTGDKVNGSVYVTGYSSTYDAPTVASVDSTAPAKTGAIGQIVAKLSDTLCLILVQGASEILGSGFTAGSMYVIGTDGLPAKSGDSTYPAVGSAVIPLGPALSTTRILSLRGVPAGAASATASSGLIGTISAISGALSANAETAFDKKVTVPAGVLRAGDIVRIKGRVRVTVGATTDTLAVKVKYGSLAVLSVSATDYAADSCVSFDITLKVLSATTAAVTSLYVAGVLGTATMKDGSILGAQTIVTATAVDVTVTADWSQDSTDAAVLEDLAVWKN
jgi:hypothetical protein